MARLIGSYARASKQARPDSKTEKTRKQILAKRFGNKAIIAVSEQDGGYKARGKSISGTGQTQKITGLQVEKKQVAQTPKQRISRQPYAARTGVLAIRQGQNTVYTTGLQTDKGWYAQRTPQTQDITTQTTTGGRKATYVNIDSLTDDDVTRAIEAERNQLERSRQDIRGVKATAKTEKAAFFLPTSTKDQLIISQTLAAAQGEKERDFVKETTRRRDIRETAAAQAARLDIDAGLKESFGKRQQDKYFKQVDAGIKDLNTFDYTGPEAQRIAVKGLEEQKSIGGKYEALTGIPKNLVRLPGDMLIMGSKEGYGSVPMIASQVFKREWSPKKIEIVGLSQQIKGFKFAAKTTPAQIGTAAFLLATPLVARGVRPGARAITTRFYQPKVVGGTVFKAKPIYNPRTGITTQTSKAYTRVKTGFKTQRIIEESTTITGDKLGITFGRAQIAGKPQSRIFMRGGVADIDGVRVTKGVTIKPIYEKGQAQIRPFSQNIYTKPSYYNTKTTVLKIPETYGKVTQEGVIFRTGYTETGTELIKGVPKSLSASEFYGATKTPKGRNVITGITAEQGARREAIGVIDALGTEKIRRVRDISYNTGYLKFGNLPKAKNIIGNIKKSLASAKPLKPISGKKGAYSLFSDVKRSNRLKIINSKSGDYELISKPPKLRKGTRRPDLRPPGGIGETTTDVFDDLGKIGTYRGFKGLEGVGIVTGGIKITNIGRGPADINILTPRTGSAYDSLYDYSVKTSRAFRQGQDRRLRQNVVTDLDTSLRLDTSLITTPVQTGGQGGTNPPTIPPPLLPLAAPFSLPFGGGGSGVSRGVRRVSAKGRYTPSVQTVALGLKSTRSYKAALTGLGRR